VARGSRLNRHSGDRLRELPIMLLAWLLGWPLGLLWLRRHDQIVFIGRGVGEFSDNAKYLYLHACTDPAARSVRSVFLSTDRRVVAALLSAGLPAVRYPSWRGILLLLRSAAVVVDSAEWVQHGRWQLASGALKVQLWHGAPLKMIELMDLGRRLNSMDSLRRLAYRLYIAAFRRQPRYDLVSSSSRFFTERVFRDSFRARRIMESGFPRNDVLDRNTRDRLGAAVWINTDDLAVRRMRELAGNGIRVALYAPTFRTHGRNPAGDEVLDYARLDAFARARRLCIIVKLHPLLAGLGPPRNYGRIIEYGADRDVYPVLCETDLLITDYSSIYFDFLLLDRPMIFFACDLNRYRSEERPLLFDYDEMTPGPKAFSQPELEHAIARVLDGEDVHAGDRRRVRALAFDDADAGAMRRTWTQVAERLAGAGAGRP
jgi:CDP-glycerol glycerophosphotransferase (TagB/SpsB family)